MVYLQFTTEAGEKTCFGPATCSNPAG